MIHKGLKFISTTFSAKAEVVDVREDKNEVDVKIIPSDGNEYIEKGWNLKRFKRGFENGDFQVYKQNDADRNISVF